MIATQATMIIATKDHEAEVRNAIRSPVMQEVKSRSSSSPTDRPTAHGT
jgi:hypothetical protein